MKKIIVIFQKEMLDNLRDRRSWMTGMFWALFGPLLLGGMIMLIGNTIREKVEESLVLPVAGAEYAPNLIAFLEQQDVTIKPAPADPKAAVIAGDINVALVITSEYGKTSPVEKPRRCNLSLIVHVNLPWQISAALKLCLKAIVTTSAYYVSVCAV